MSNSGKSIFAKLPGAQNSMAARIAWIWMLLILLIAILGPLIANEKPYYCKLDGVSYFPLFSGTNEATLSRKHPDHSPVNWKETAFESVWYSPVPYSYFSIDLEAGSHLSPFASQRQPLRFRHWLGTDGASRDVLAGMIRGCRVSLLIGLGSMLLALLLGVPLGAASAYWGNHRIKTSIWQLLVLVLWMAMLIYLFTLPLSFGEKIIPLFILILSGVWMWLITGKIKRSRIHFPLDNVTMSVISIFDSFPGLFLIIIVLVILPVKGWLMVLIVIALMRWPVMARYMRAEVFKMKEMPYIKSVQVLNLPDMHILNRDIIPYAFRPVMISFIFGVSSAILAESSLSFLGIGLPVEELNWGKLLAQSRNHFDAWWLVLFPGAAIFFTLLSLYTIGNAAEKSIEHGATPLTTSRA